MSGPKARLGQDVRVVFRGRGLTENFSRQHRGARNSSVESGKDGLVCSRQFEQVPVGEFRMRLCESRQSVGTKRVVQHLESNRAGCFQSGKSLTSGRYVGLESCLNRHTQETQFGDCARVERRSRCGQGAIPSGGSRMVDVRGVPEGDQRIDVKEMLHGKSARMARTS